jgi:hypothetical protein
MEIKNQRGQTLVEYILLIAVAASLFLTFYRSAAFRRLFGEQGEIGTKLKAQHEFAYRHAFYATGPGRTTVGDISKDNKDIAVHPSYVEPSGETHFFGPKNPYGQP